VERLAALHTGRPQGFGKRPRGGEKGYDWRTDPNPRLIVTGKHLNVHAPPLDADCAKNAFVERDQPWIGVGIFIPSYGCWQITGRYGDDQLT
jgi:hypothetical protein